MCLNTSNCEKVDVVEYLKSHTHNLYSTCNYTNSIHSFIIIIIITIMVIRNLKFIWWEQTSDVPMDQWSA